MREKTKKKKQTAVRFCVWLFVIEGKKTAKSKLEPGNTIEIVKTILIYIN